MDKRFLSILGVIVAVFFGVLFWNTKHAKPTDVTPTNHVVGKLDSSVTFLEYGDYQCNACQYYSSTVNQVRAKYADRVKFQFRNLPLTSIHPNAFAAARAAEAASKQGKFWEMHDALYTSSNWQAWITATDPTSHFVQYATQLGLNIDQFKQDFSSPTVNDTINADSAEFEKTGQQKATPAFFINGKFYELEKFVDNTGPSVTAFSKVLDEALAKSP